VGLGNTTAPHQLPAERQQRVAAYRSASARAMEHGTTAASHR
jgi:hypothetical protein